MEVSKGYDHDIFISYAHVDNEPPDDDRDGWVDTLHRHLQSRLNQLSGEPPNIWRDAKLKGNDYFDETIRHELLRSAVLVSVFSPRYVKSEWCTKELRTFLEALPPDDDNKSRVFKVVKTPLRNDQPAGFEELYRALGYEFYRKDPSTNRFREFNQIYGPDAEQQYWDKLEDLAYDLSERLYQLKRQVESPPAQPSSGKIVFLCETTFDMSPQRDQIRRELQQYGHVVLPDQQLPLYAPELEKMVRKEMERSELSIHIIGESYGIVPDKEPSKRSIVEVQWALATEQSKVRSLSRVVWIPKGLSISDEDQLEFVTTLRNDESGADLLETDLKDLRSLLQDRLTPQKPPAGIQDTIYVYLLCSSHDEKDVEPLDNFLYDQGFEVKLPLFDGEGQMIEDHHREMLQLCNAILIYYGTEKKLWVEQQLSDLRQISDLQQKAVAIYVTNPKDEDRKERFRTREVDRVIHHFDTFSPEILDPFLEIIEAKQGGQML